MSDPVPAVHHDASKDAPVVSAFKGFDMDLRCRDFQFEIGKTYSISGPVVACENGFHACEHPLDCFGYYAPATSRYCEVKQFGETQKKGTDTKIASAKITIGFELSIGEMVARAVKWVMDRAIPEKGGHATGDQGAASATGYRGAASATGYQGAASDRGPMPRWFGHGGENVAISLRAARRLGEWLLAEQEEERAHG